MNNPAIDLERVEVVRGGSRSYAGGSARHANIVSDHFAYKVVGEYTRGDDWRFDPNDPADQQSLAIGLASTECNNTTKKIRLKTEGVYRFGENGTGAQMTGRLGYTQSSFLLLTPQPVNVDNYGALSGQVRFDAGPFFAQVYGTTYGLTENQTTFLGAPRRSTTSRSPRAPKS